MVKHINLPDQHHCEQLASQMALCLFSPLVLTFSGEIGAGKTTFIRAMLRALGVAGAIKSPTYSLIESYTCDKLLIHHFDLYRIHDEAELEYIGFRDYFTNDSICCIEWPERAGSSLGGGDINFMLTVEGSGRLMAIQALSNAGESVLSCLASKP